jgi:hypothetical protein
MMLNFIMGQRCPRIEYPCGGWHGGHGGGRLAAGGGHRELTAVSFQSFYFLSDLSDFPRLRRIELIWNRFDWIQPSVQILQYMRPSSYGSLATGVVGTSIILKKKSTVQWRTAPNWRYKV